MSAPFLLLSVLQVQSRLQRGLVLLIWERRLQKRNTTSYIMWKSFIRWTHTLKYVIEYCSQADEEDTAVESFETQTVSTTSATGRTFRMCLVYFYNFGCWCKRSKFNCLSMWILIRIQSKHRMVVCVRMFAKLFSFNMNANTNSQSDSSRVGGHKSKWNIVSALSNFSKYKL